MAIDPELREYLDQRFAQVQSEQRATGVLVEDLRTEQRATGVLVEDLRARIQLVAEGVQSVDERLTQFRREVAAQFAEQGALIRLSYLQLEQRITTLETKASEFETRLVALESGGH